MTDTHAAKIIQRHEKAPQGPRPFWPTTFGDARKLIKETMDANRWDARSQRFYLNNLGIRPVPIERLSKDECRTVLERMKRTRMIIFAEDVANPMFAAGVGR
jgi:hypothetical protein